MDAVFCADLNAVIVCWTMPTRLGLSWNIDMGYPVCEFQTELGGDRCRNDRSFKAAAYLVMLSTP